MRASTRWVLRLVLALLGLVCVSCLGMCLIFWADISASHDRYLRFQGLLRGDPEIRVTRIEGFAGGKPFVIDDPESLDALTTLLRLAEPDGYVPKRGGCFDGPRSTVRARVWTGRPEPYETSFELPNDERVSGMTVFCGYDDTYYYWVPLPPPVPAPLSAAFAAERQWDRDRRPRR